MIDKLWKVKVYYRDQSKIIRILKKIDFDNLELVIAMNTSSSDRQSYKCDLCHFDSAYAVSLKTHMRTHTAEKPFKCNVCDYASVRADSLKLHLKTHTKEKSHKCNLTNSYQRKTLQLQHLWLCICSCKHFEDTFENSHWRKNK